MQVLGGGVLTLGIYSEHCPLATSSKELELLNANVLDRPVTSACPGSCFV